MRPALALVVAACVLGTASAALSVNYKSPIKAGLNIITLQEGTPQTFTATASGGTAPYTSVWQVAALYSSTWVDISAHGLAPFITFSTPTASDTAMRIGLTYSSYEKYQYRVKITDNAAATVTSDPLWFRLNATSYTILQASQSSLATRKSFKVYWNSAGGEADYPAFALDLVRVSKSSLSASQFLGINRITTVDPISGEPIFTNEFAAPSVAGVDTLWTIVQDYVTMTFDGASNDGSDLEGWLQSAVEAACVAAYPGTSFKAYFSGFMSSGSSTQATVYVRNYNTGKIMTKANLEAALANGGGLGQFAAGVAAAGLPFTTYTTTQQTFATFLSSENFFLSVDENSALQFSWAPYPVTAESNSFLFNIIPGTVAGYTEAAPFVGQARFQIQSVRDNTKYVKVQPSGTSPAITLVTDNTDTQTMFVRTSTEEGYLTDALLGDSWAAARCATNSLEATAGSQTAQNVNDCEGLPNNPTYRRLEVDLGGEFFLTTVEVVMPNRPFTLSGDSSPFTIAGIQLYGRQDGNNTWLLIDQKFTTDTCKSATDSCSLTYSVGTYSRNTLRFLGNRGFRYLRLILSGIDVFNDRVPENARYFAINEFKVTGMCICNGHSKFCNLQTGACTEYDSNGNNSPGKTCGHSTTGTNCGICDEALNVYVNPRNKNPFDKYSCNADGLTNCDGPGLPEYSPTEIEARRTISGTTIASDNAAFFQLMFPLTGPCTPCVCYGHNELEQGVSTKSCHLTTGVCTCAASRHVQGDHCETCVPGYCRTCNSTATDVSTATTCRLNACTQCACNKHSVNKLLNGDDLCEADSCQCTCADADHVEGTNCEKCKKGYWNAQGDGTNGATCTDCQCNGHKASFNNECAALGGDCMKDRDGGAQACEGNTEGPHCEYCKPGFYRDFKDGSIDPKDDCKPCSCNSHGVAKGYAGLLAGQSICDPDGGVCNCDAAHNVEGDHCEKCKHGFWNAQGNGEGGATCTACSCNGHKATSNNECMAKGGDCMKDFDGNDQPCEGNTMGAHCDTCKDGFYRVCAEHAGYPFALPDLTTKICTVVPTQDCVACGCNGHHSTTVGGTSDPMCDKVGGVCDCLDNTEGAFCEFCKTNFWNDVGDGQNGRKCKPCECYDHSSTCSNVGVCSGCADNTRNGGDNKCEVCKAGHKRLHVKQSTYDKGIPADVENIKYEGCTPCNCNTHSKKDPVAGDGICEEFDGVCYQCGDNTVNGDAGECEKCDEGYFRNLDAVTDTCLSYNLANGHGNTARDLTSACLPCSAQCFGSAKTCTETTGECTACADVNAEGVRCERCKQGYFGDPVNGIPCRACRCYHSVQSTFTGVASATIGDSLRCALDASLLTSNCYLDHTIAAGLDQLKLKNPSDDEIYKAIKCACPREPGAHGGQFDGTDGHIYTGATCDGCNTAAYYGRPRQCNTNPTGDLLTCSDFETCNPCNCNGNIDQTQAIENCKPDTQDPKCENCLGHTTGDHCEDCERGYYGDATRSDVPGKQGTGYVLDAADKSLKCFKCDCNGVAVTPRVNNADGTDGDWCEATDDGHEGQYKCTCDGTRGYKGTKCRECKRGYQLKAGHDWNGDPNPAYDYCEPCPQCVIDVYTFSVDPLESGMVTLAADVIAVNDTIHSVVDATQTTLDAISTVSTTLTNALNALQQSVTDANTGLTTSLNTLSTTLATQQGDLNTRITNANTALSALDGRLTTLTTNVGTTKATLDASIATLSGSATTLTNRANGLDTSISNLATTTTTTLNALSSSVTGLSNDVSNLQDALNDAAATVATTLQELQDKIGDGTIDVVDFAHTVENRRAALLDALHDLNATVQAAAATFDNRFTLLESRLSASVAELSAFIDGNGDRIDDLTTSVGAAQTRADAVKAAVDAQSGGVSTSLENMRASLQAQIDLLNGNVTSAGTMLDSKVASAFAALTAASRTIEDKLIDDLWPSVAQATLTDFAHVSDIVGTLGSSAVITCGRGGAGSLMRFVGKNTSYAMVPATDAFSDLSNGLTVSVWVTQLPNNDGYILAKGSVTGTTRYFALWSEGSRDRFHLFFLPRTLLSTYRQSTITLKAPLDDGTAHHVVVVVTSTTTPRAFLYIDGVQVGEFPNMAAMTETSKVPLWIGARPPNAFNFNGTLDDLRIYSRDISGADISRLYALPAVSNSPVPFTLVAANTTFNQTTQKPDLTFTSTSDGFVTPIKTFTLSAWVKQVPNDDGYIVAKTDATGNVRPFAVYASGTAGQLSVYYRPANATTYKVVSVKANIDDNRLHHIAVVVDRHAATFYVDGVQKATPQALAGPFIDDPTYTLYVGRRPGAANQFFQGSMSKVRLYFDQALCASTVSALYAEGAN